MKNITQQINERLGGFVIGGTLLTWLIIAGLVFLIPICDKLSWAQVVIELVLVPLVLYGFYQTRKDIKDSQQIPDINLYWDGEIIEDDKTITFLHRGGDTLHFPMTKLSIKNSGKRIARIYSVAFHLEEILTSEHGLWEHDHILSTAKFTCVDNSGILFPDDERSLDHFSIRTPFIDERNFFIVNYYIYCDGASMKEGIIRLLYYMNE